MDAEVRTRELVELIKSNEKKYFSSCRKWLIEIDDLGGYSVLGYQTFKEMVEKLFSSSFNYYLDQLVTGRIELLVGIPIGTYAGDALDPFRKYRINFPLGNCRGGTKPNEEGRETLLKAWEKALSIAQENNRELPNRQDIKAAAQFFPAKKGKPVGSGSRPSCRKPYEVLKRDYESLVLQVKNNDTVPQEEVKNLREYLDLISSERDELKRELKAGKTAIERYKLQNHQLKKEVEGLRRSLSLLSNKLQPVGARR